MFLLGELRLKVEMEEVKFSESWNYIKHVKAEHLGTKNVQDLNPSTIKHLSSLVIVFSYPLKNLIAISYKFIWKIVLTKKLTSTNRFRNLA